ncbi:hypothetical protein HCU40_25025 [Pseudanabaena biceps]|nr:hypothetical protein [Pseudanabaena biceps]
MTDQPIDTPDEFEDLPSETPARHEDLPVRDQPEEAGAPQIAADDAGASAMIEDPQPEGDRDGNEAA